MKKLGIVFIILFQSLVVKADLLKDFDSLGGNDTLINRAKALQPEKDVRVVQERTVDRRLRSEISAGYNNVIGGDAYLQTQMLTAQYFFHINPYWTVGLGYFSAFNELSREGQYLITNDNLVPDVDQPESGYEVMGHFAPIYGKINLFNQAVLQFDLYGIGSYGNIQLNSGETNTFSVGAGFGLWISQHLTTRLEIRQRFYEAQRLGSATQIETTSAGFSLGYIL